MTPKEIQKLYPSFNAQRFFLKSNREPTVGAFYLTDSSNCADSKPDIAGNWKWFNNNCEVVITIALQRSEPEKAKRINYLKEMNSTHPTIFLFKRKERNNFIPMGKYDYVSYSSQKGCYLLKLKKALE